MKNITIEVAFATDKLQKIISTQIEEGKSIHYAIMTSNINSYFPELPLINNPDIAYGIWGKRIASIESYQLKNGDRLEIYRKLQQSPNQKRLSKIKA